MRCRRDGKTVPWTNWEDGVVPVEHAWLEPTVTRRQRRAGSINLYGAKEVIRFPDARSATPFNLGLAAVLRLPIPLAALGRRLEEQAGRTMQAVVVSRRRVADSMASTTTASQAHSTGIEQAKQSVGQITPISRQHAALGGKAAAVARSLQQ